MKSCLRTVESLCKDIEEVVIDIRIWEMLEEGGRGNTYTLLESALRINVAVDGQGGPGTV